MIRQPLGPIVSMMTSMPEAISAQLKRGLSSITKGWIGLCRYQRSRVREPSGMEVKTINQLQREMNLGKGGPTMMLLLLSSGKINPKVKKTKRGEEIDQQTF